ncbi:MAG TPA: hypothetical protein VF147_16955 [Vicinamibacterales bacterium]
MLPLSSAAVLAVWESASERSPAERALSLLTTCEPDTPVEQLARLSVGQRDVRLFELRAATFGQRLEVVGTCPDCTAPFELETRVRDLLVDTRRDIDPVGEVDADDVHVRFRLPDSMDLAVAARAPSAARLLLERCVVEAQRGGTRIAAEELAPAIVQAVGNRMREIDPQSEVELVLTCPSCGHRWRDLFDIASFLWTEIETLALRLLQEVDVLARAYAWSEADILAMTPRRRRLYLDMATT